jgi:hypothetical protein
MSETFSRAPDWVPLARAPFYYSRTGFLRSPEARKQHAASLAPPNCGTAVWSVDESDVVFTFGGRTSRIDVKYGIVSIQKEDESIIFAGTPDECFKAAALHPRNWHSDPGDSDVIALTHFTWLRAILVRMHFDFEDALVSGAATIMARPGSPLAPFRRIEPDQWRYFRPKNSPMPMPVFRLGSAYTKWVVSWLERLGKPGERIIRVITYRPAVTRWASPRPRILTASAKGPGGEMLFSIHVAPGSDHKADSPETPEEQCIRWLANMRGIFPDRAPDTLDNLRAQAMSEIDGLTNGAWDRAIIVFKAAHNGEGYFPRGRRKNGEKIPAK